MAADRLAAHEVLLITGSMGSGKSTVLAEASDILTVEGIPHALIDLDELSTVHLPSHPAADSVMYRNLRCVWRNYASYGANRLLLARAIETRADLELCRAAVSARKLVVCRLKAPVEIMRERVRSREIGLLQQRFVARVAELDAALDRASLEDFSLTNENRPVTEVAREMLTRSGWI